MDDCDWQYFVVSIECFQRFLASLLCHVDDNSVLQRRAKSLQIHLRIAYMQLSIPLIRDCIIHGSLQMLLCSIGTRILDVVGIVVVIGDWMSSLVF